MHTETRASCPRDRTNSHTRSSTTPLASIDERRVVLGASTIRDTRRHHPRDTCTRVSGSPNRKPRGDDMAEVETRASGGESAKRKHIVWNEENLSYNEANKSVRAAPGTRDGVPADAPPQLPFFSPARVPETLRTDRPTLRPPPHRVSQAKMKIDEPDTPWASPPKELFEDPEHDGADVVAAMDDVADRLKAIDAEAGGPGAARTVGTVQSRAEGRVGLVRRRGRRGRGAAATETRLPGPGRFRRVRGSGDAEIRSDEDEDAGAIDDADRVLKARLFEAQRKSHQCTFRGMMARGRALLDEDEDLGE